MMLDIWKPEIFHGRRKNKDFFEGWYFKMVDYSEKRAYAVIPGVSIARDPLKSHAFIMFLDARAQKMNYFRYSLDDMKAGDKKFELTIGESFFSTSEMNLNLKQGRDRIIARISFKDTYSWPVKVLSPGVMGWYAFVPGMECYHGILSMDHAVEGFIEVNGIRKDLNGGRGYIEKDWGVSMPSSWIWMQTNHFDRNCISLSGSIAKIPWLGNYFTGYIFGFLYNKKLYKFTTYSGAKVTGLDVTDDKIKIRLENKAYYLDINADRSEGVELPAPKLGEMTAKVNESLHSSINVTLLRKTGSDTKLIYSGTGKNAGLELVGNVDELIKGLKKASNRW
ncbi:tocopherol cyclase family protein [Methanosarcina sp.]|uniref:tocopherol cyclase family protein n=1 Tax=Methanosarcina sp. TaxID=2213 RepID=UPI00298900A6|nr:tocopherol cyclase family protein [Methanosarcina sp.]MDW5550254.1 tocopherol cyclase family protein [Methanosarcina sp.]MDW5554082.1 tocopherol cyclase family protein [Methanosarcina sp.]MDW5560277.1 tocopherol cyclase family protein [Methanosarcina sp.]